MAKKPQHSGPYHRQAMRLRALAYANPHTTCARCGKPLQPGVKGYDRWDAGHAIDGDPSSPLRPEHAYCNRSAGATMGNEKRRTAPPSRRW